jgi:hypothetical protein
MNSHPVLIVLLIAVAAPLLTEIPIGVRLPTVVLGVIIGPQVLGLAISEGLLGWLGGKLGLAALFFMAGTGTRSRAGSGPPPDAGDSRLGSVPRHGAHSSRSSLPPARRAFADHGRPGAIHDRARDA